MIHRSALIAVCCIPAVIGIGCGSSEPAGDDYDVQLYLPITQLDFAAEGGYMNLEVISDGNIAWEITDLPSWLTASPSSAAVSANVRVTAQPNPDAVERSGKFSVISTSSAFPIAWTVTVAQAAGSL